MTTKDSIILVLCIIYLVAFTALFIIQSKEMCEDIKAKIQKTNWKQVMRTINGPTLQEIFLQMEVVNNFLLRRLARLGVSRSEVDGFSFEQILKYYQQRLNFFKRVGRAVANLNSYLKKKGKDKARIVFPGLLNMTNEQLDHALLGYATQGCLPDVPLYD